MSEYRDLGMDRRIPRRDFLNGAAIGIAGAFVGSRTASAWPERGASSAPSRRRQAGIASAAAYPPARTGLRGNYPSAVEAFGPMTAGEQVH